MFQHRRTACAVMCLRSRAHVQMLQHFRVSDEEKCVCGFTAQKLQESKHGGSHSLSAVTFHLG